MKRGTEGESKTQRDRQDGAAQIEREEGERNRDTQREREKQGERQRETDRNRDENNNRKQNKDRAVAPSEAVRHAKRVSAANRDRNRERGRPRESLGVAGPPLSVLRWGRTSLWGWRSLGQRLGPLACPPFLHVEAGPLSR